MSILNIYLNIVYRPHFNNFGLVSSNKDIAFYLKDARF